MSRIRSIHPGVWTDEAFMSLSAHARLLLIGIWTEAWDDGVFEWKPITLKAKIFPVDNVNVTDLLGELFNANLINRAESHPKQPGLIRNFQKFQRPKKPNSSGMLPNEWREYVGAAGTERPTTRPSSEPVPNQFRTSTEKSPQMEDGGCNSEANASAPAYPVDPVERLWAEGVDLMALMDQSSARARPLIGRWLKETRNDAGRVLDAIRRAHEHGTKDPAALVARMLNPITKPNGGQNGLREATDFARTAAAQIRGRQSDGAGPGAHGDDARFLPRPG